MDQYCALIAPIYVVLADLFAALRDAFAGLGEGSTGDLFVTLFTAVRGWAESVTGCDLGA